jgi:hypothetical protein
MKYILSSLRHAPVIVGILFTLTIQSFQVVTFAADSQFSDFQSIRNVTDSKLTTVNRIAVTLPILPEKGYAILETTTNRLQPTFSRSLFELNDIATTIAETSPITTGKDNLKDKDFKTSTRFDFDKSSGYSFVVLKLDKPINTTSLSYYLDSNVQNPEEIAIQSKLSGGSNEYQTILSRRENSNNSVSFPDTLADTFKVEFFHRQPLRIQELEIGKPTNKLTGYQIIWLGRPGENYRMYTDSQKYIDLPTEETVNLANIDDTIIPTTLGELETNPDFKESDTDKDTIVDKSDNCPYIFNTDQIDTDKNGKGDICEDKDGDGVLDGFDNCPTFANRSQIDTDANKIGDICEDKDNDKIPNGTDNCPDTANLDQKDTDQDKIGDACDKNGESRWLQNNQIINGEVLGIGFAVIGGLGYMTIRRRK